MEKNTISRKETINEFLAEYNKQDNHKVGKVVGFAKKGSLLGALIFSDFLSPTSGIYAHDLTAVIYKDGKFYQSTGERKFTMGQCGFGYIGKPQNLPYEKSKNIELTIDESDGRIVIKGDRFDKIYGTF